MYANGLCNGIFEHTPPTYYNSRLSSNSRENHCSLETIDLFVVNNYLPEGYLKFKQIPIILYVKLEEGIHFVCEGDPQHFQLILLNK